ncbi:hypothetical protein ACE6H2_022926 [Prunus campanulata]
MEAARTPKLMAENDPVAASAQKYKPMQSACFPRRRGKLYDTPGFISTIGKKAAVVHSEDPPALAPQSRLRGQSFPLVNDNSNGLNGYSIISGGVVRVL